MKNYYLLFLLLIIFSCKPVNINQYFSNPDKSRDRNGFWIEDESTDLGIVQSKGKYIKGKKIGTWKTYYEDHLIQKEKFRKDRSKILVYHPNGKIRQRGQTRTEIEGSNYHWFYFGDWKFYDEKGQLQYIKKYENGHKTDSISINKKGSPSR